MGRNVNGLQNLGATPDFLDMGAIKKKTIFHWPKARAAIV